MIPAGSSWNQFRVILLSVLGNKRSFAAGLNAHLSFVYGHVIIWPHTKLKWEFRPAAKLRLFPKTLKRITLNWFQELPAGIITNFSVLQDLFIHQFVARNREKKTSLYLMVLKQEKTESLVTTSKGSTKNHWKFQTYRMRSIRCPDFRAPTRSVEMVLGWEQNKNLL